MEEENISHQKILAAVGTTGVCRKVWLSDQLSVLLCAHLKRAKIKSIQVWEKDPNPAGLGLPLHSICIHIYVCIHTMIYISYGLEGFGGLTSSEALRSMTSPGTYFGGL